jgi:nucleotide-binding universal stress UspA family protein
MKILLAADGSAFTIKAVKYLTTHLDLFGARAELHLLTVTHPIPHGLAAANARKFLGDKVLDEYYREEAEAALTPAEKILRKSDIPFHANYKVGVVADEIVAYAKKNKADMIVMGSHGHGALANVLLGSVATRVLAAATVPVLIIR